MYVRNLKIKRLKLLRDFELSFLNPDDSPRMWTVIIGENGTGKTSILQAIALAAAGSLQVNTLGEAVVDVLRDRRANEAMQIEVDFGFSAGRHSNRPYPGLPQGQARPDQPPRLVGGGEPRGADQRANKGFVSSVPRCARILFTTAWGGISTVLTLLRTPATCKRPTGSSRAMASHAPCPTTPPRSPYATPR
ncbi:MAG: AAA family ATPase [Deltaproteobacteria bacterium]|nr:AAA family ATPase [Deltaproteobacteria bacterium]